MKFMRVHGPLLRAVGVLSAAAIITTGVTYAALQSKQAVLAGNTIQSATADLRIGTSASSFDQSRNGFSFKDLVPGGPAMPADGFNFYLKNYGTATLVLKVVGGGSITNTSGVDLTKISLQLTRVDTGAEQVVSLQTLVDSGLALTDPIAPGTVVQYKLRASMDAAAFEGTAAVVGGLDLVYSGIGIAAN